MSPIIQSLANASAYGYRSLSAAVTADTGAYFPLQVVTVGSAGASSISFSNIPSTYTHLQLRFLLGSARATSSYSAARVTFNSDTGSNYASHRLFGDGSTVTADAQTSQTALYSTWYPNGSKQYYGVAVMDILDYANTNKYKTVRTLSGVDDNNASTAGVIGLQSGLWLSTSAITSISIAEGSGSNNFLQYSQIALYGIKGA